LTDIADAQAEVFQHGLVARDLVAVEREAVEAEAGEAADEERTLPFGNGIAGVERHAGGADGGHPVVDGLFHAGRRTFALADRQAAIFRAIGDDGPAVIFAGLGNVHFIAAARSVFAGPEFARFRVERRALLVAVAPGPDFGQRAVPVHKGVVVRHRSVRPDADDFSKVG